MTNKVKSAAHYLNTGQYVDGTAQPPLGYHPVSTK